MRKFMSTCIDNVLRLPMVYSECSLNGACFQLETEGFEIKSVLPIKINNKEYDYISSFHNNTVQYVYFIYDEKRGYLILDDEEKYKDYRFK